MYGRCLAIRLRCVLLLGLVYDLNGNFNFYTRWSSYSSVDFIHVAIFLFFCFRFVFLCHIQTLALFCTFCFLCWFHFSTSSFVHFLEHLSFSSLCVFFSHCASSYHPQNIHTENTEEFLLCLWVWNEWVWMIRWRLKMIRFNLTLDTEYKRQREKEKLQHKTSWCDGEKEITK